MFGQRKQIFSLPANYDVTKLFKARRSPVGLRHGQDDQQVQDRLPGRADNRRPEAQQAVGGQREKVQRKSEAVQNRRPGTSTVAGN